MNILGLDPANRCGWAHTNGKSGVWMLNTSGTEHDGNRLVRLERNIIEAHERFGVDRVAFELAAYGSPHLATKQFHNALRGIIIMTAAKIGATYEQFEPTTIKKFATDNGRALKPDMVRACKTFLNLDITDEDEADAIWVRELAKQRYDQKWREQGVKRGRPTTRKKSSRE